MAVNEKELRTALETLQEKSPALFGYIKSQAVTGAVNSFVELGTEADEKWNQAAASSNPVAKALAYGESLRAKATQGVVALGSAYHSSNNSFDTPTGLAGLIHGRDDAEAIVKAGEAAKTNAGLVNKLADKFVIGGGAAGAGLNQNAAALSAVLDKNNFAAISKFYNGNSEAVGKLLDNQALLQQVVTAAGKGKSGAAPDGAAVTAAIKSLSETRAKNPEAFDKAFNEGVENNTLADTIRYFAENHETIARTQAAAEGLSETLGIKLDTAQGTPDQEMLDWAANPENAQKLEQLKAQLKAAKDTNEPLFDLALKGISGAVAGEGNKAFSPAELDEIIEAGLKLTDKEVYGNLSAIHKATLGNPAVAGVFGKQIESALAAGDGASLFETVEKLEALAEKRQQITGLAKAVSGYASENPELAGKVIASFLQPGTAQGADLSALDNIKREDLAQLWQGAKLVNSLYPEASAEDFKKHLGGLQQLSKLAKDKEDLLAKIGIDITALAEEEKELSAGTKLVAKYALENPKQFFDSIEKLTAGEGGAAISKDDIEKILASEKATKSLLTILQKPEIATEALALLNDKDVIARLEQFGVQVGGDGGIAALLESDKVQAILEQMEKHPEKFGPDTIKLLGLYLKNAPQGLVDKILKGEELGVMDYAMLAGLQSNPEISQIIKDNPHALYGVVDLAMEAIDDPKADEALASIQRNRTAEVQSNLLKWADQMGLGDSPIAMFFIAVIAFASSYFSETVSHNLADAKSPFDAITNVVDSTMNKDKDNSLGGTAPTGLPRGGANAGPVYTPATP